MASVRLALPNRSPYTQRVGDERPDPRQAFCKGDRTAFAALARPHLDTVFTLCLRMTGNRAEAEDLAQDALCRAMENCHRYDPTREFRPWLLTIAANLCRDRVRGGWWRGLARRLQFDRHLRDDEDALADADSDAHVRRALATLPTHYREALALFHLSEMSYEEMSLVTGVGVSALKQRVRRGSALLRDAVTEMYPDRALARTLAEPK